tara:strand:+ start:262 stop:1116 length:855 start_codon:yes stop_codon:yes gene_type:complete
VQFKKKLFIGTAQFLSNYGITNNIYTDKKYCLNLLEHAAKKGIMNYDTAVGYKSEKLIGEFLKTHKISRAKICTKFYGLQKDYKSQTYSFLDKSLKKLNNPIYCIFFHNAQDIKFFIRDPEFFLDLTNQFPISKIGFSIYEKKDIKNVKFTKQISLQIPYNILNNEFNDLKLLKKYDNIFARSLFLQGVLINKNINKNINKKFCKMLQTYFMFLKKENINPLDLNLNYINQNTKLDYYIFGFEKKKQLDEILSVKKKILNKKIITTVKNIFKNDKNIDPRLWKS